MQTPFYDPEKTYEENFEDGPFGAFADVTIPRVPLGNLCYDFLGTKVNSPFGIPAGPLINGNFCKAAFEKGFDICVYKTVRSGVYPCHPWPNVLAVHVPQGVFLGEPDLRLVANQDYTEPLSITNSFGVPSRDPKVWQEDVKRAISYAGPGQVLVLSFMGTVREGQTEQEFVADYALAAKLAYETGAKILEVNLSCPNIGNEGLVCYDFGITAKICEAIRAEIGETPLVLKVGYYKNEEDVKKLAKLAQKYAQAIAAINTIPAEIVDENGKQALPGTGRVKSGVCGASIRWAGLEMTRKLKKVRDATGRNFKIIGVGGIMKTEDFFDYRSAGADVVMSATGAMWNPYLAEEIKKSYE